MDPKATQLDPKLQEAYDRVMGVAATTTPTTTQQPPEPVHTPPEAPTLPVAPGMQPATDAAPTAPTPVMPQVATSTPPAMSLQPDQNALPTQPMLAPQETSGKKAAFVAKSGMKIPVAILAIGAVVFLVIYTLVWIKVFNLPIPFINQ